MILFTRCKRTSYMIVVLCINSKQSTVVSTKSQSKRKLLLDVKYAINRTFPTIHFFYYFLTVF